ncbi:MAG TPA: ATP-binding protein, partial [Candidatus Saccharibacteria bacterium]|nr:ATP-binding protein [Candidatus Saccharibacteria bacterium]
CTEMKIDKGEIVVFGEKQLFYENNIFKKDGDEISQRELRKLGRTMVEYESLQYGERKDLMSEYGISISMPLKTGDKFMGYLLLANKKSGDIYTTEDMKVLEVIGSELSVAVQNALSYKEIQLFSETLAERVRQRTAQLKNANDQLKILDQAKDEFISMASHQLRTPLTTVKGYASMLDEGDFGKLSKEQREPVQLALDGANRMARLIDDLLNVSRMDANRFFLEVADVDMTKVVAEEITQLQSIAESKDVKLNYISPKEKIPEIRLDENKTRQVIMNLVDNAIHYSQPPKGGGEVNVSFELDGDHVVFIVKDNGIGVPVKVQNKLFTKMFRANNAKELRPDGTGLGLYLVKRVVQDEGGKLIFESVEGKGSTFGFTLPISGVPKTVEAQSRKIGAKVAATSKS